jgi:hypothetical protein
MTTTYKVLGQAVTTANTLGTVYTVPASTSTVCSTISICNTTTGNANVRVAIQPGNAAIALKHYIVYDSQLVNNDTLFLTVGATLATTDVISAYANIANVSVNVYGSEIT